MRLPLTADRDARQRVAASRQGEVAAAPGSQRDRAVAGDLMPARETCPAPAAPGEEAVESRPATLSEYEQMRD